MINESESIREINGTVKKKAKEDFQNIILNYAERHKIDREIYNYDDVVLRQGERCGDLLILCEGAVNILVKKPEGKDKRPIASRTAIDIIGEHGYLHKNTTRTATVTAATRNAEFLRISQEQMNNIMDENPEIKELMSILNLIEARRLEEVQTILADDIHIENEMISVIIADMHDFTMVGNNIIEEHLNAFLFDFIECSDEIVTRNKGQFEEQGDGFKAIFRGDKREILATCTAIEIREVFNRIVKNWKKADSIFQHLRLGIGICTNIMSIRRLKCNPKKRGRVLSHSINIAAALSKYKSQNFASEIYMDSNTYEIVKNNGIKIVEEELLLRSLRDRFKAYRIATNVSVLHLDLGRPIENRAFNSLNVAKYLYNGNSSWSEPERKTLFVSYSHKDLVWLERLRTHLWPVVKTCKINFWDDTKIQTGSSWKKDISNALNSAKVALLLVSADYLASNFILENELTPLLDLAKEGGTTIFPIIVGPCAYHISALNEFQSLNSAKEPLSAMDENKREMFLVEASMKINEAFSENKEMVA